VGTSEKRLLSGNFVRPTGNESNGFGDHLYQDDPKDQGSPIQPNEIKPDTEDLSHKEIRCRMLEMAKASFPNGIPSRCLII